MPIPASDARALFTQTFIDLYKERPRVMTFLRSFFMEKEASTKNVSIEVVRGTERVAVDVMRGTEGNRNTWSKSTQKVFEPPYFREYMDLTQLDLYDRLIGSTTIDEGVFADLMTEALEYAGQMMDKIERAYEIQCAQVLETGIVTLVNGDNIDFKRKSASLVATSDDYFATTVTPYNAFEKGCKFIREKGKAQGGTYNAILGSTAMSDFLANAKVIERNDIKNIGLDNITGPQRDATGASFHGEITCGDYKVRLWTYPEVYEDKDGNTHDYWNTKKVAIVPLVPRFKIAYAAVPTLIKPGVPPVRGKYVWGEYQDERNTADIIDVKSAGIAIPVAVDQIYTFKAVS